MFLPSRNSYRPLSIRPNRWIGYRTNSKPACLPVALAGRVRSVSQRRFHELDILNRATLQVGWESLAARWRPRISPGHPIAAASRRRWQAGREGVSLSGGIFPSISGSPSLFYYVFVVVCSKLADVQVSFIFRWASRGQKPGLLPRAEHTSANERRLQTPAAFGGHEQGRVTRVRPMRSPPSSPSSRGFATRRPRYLLSRDPPCLDGPSLTRNRVAAAVRWKCFVYSSWWSTKAGVTREYLAGSSSTKVICPELSMCEHLRAELSSVQ